MANIESRPSRQGLWDYVFFIDIEGHGEDKGVAQALDMVKDSVKMFKLLGLIPKPFYNLFRLSIYSRYSRCGKIKISLFKIHERQR